MGEKIENFVAVLILSILCGVYIYLLSTPYQSEPFKNRKFIIPKDSKEEFERILKQRTDLYWSEGGGSFGSGEYSSAEGEVNFGSKEDDFYLKEGFVRKPNVPSDRYLCLHGWVTIRSESNYKFLWMHTDLSHWMSATATSGTPIHLRAFEAVPLAPDCEESGWVRLRPGDSDGFIMMNKPLNGTVMVDEWVVKIGSTSLEETEKDERYHFLLEQAGYIMNKGAMSFVNVMYEQDGSVRGHSSSWDRSKPAGREFGAMMIFEFVNGSVIEESIADEKEEVRLALEQDKNEIELIKQYPTSTENRVISFGLYGSREKYTTGAIRNVELAQVYFPGWKCRFYVTEDVPQEVIKQLKDYGAEIFDIPSGMGAVAGMFYRFLVAADHLVDRFIIRDADSRLNARDRIAVEEWIKSKLPIHIMRDHPNHCFPMNAGMWGGVGGALPHIEDQIKQWGDKDRYIADQNFLESQVWPDIKHKQLAHDSYCCDQYPNAKPFPTRRPPTYQHVGQVFDEYDQPRLLDIEAYIRGVPTLNSCRKQPDWIYG